MFMHDILRYVKTMKHIVYKLHQSAVKWVLLATQAEPFTTHRRLNGTVCSLLGMSSTQCSYMAAEKLKTKSSWLC